MSEEKVIQHAGKAFHALQDQEKRWTHKLKEFFVEILIIVFAVSITLLLHNWNDARHERKLAREFLEGIKSDLDSAALDLEEGITYYQPNLDYYDSMRHQIATHHFNAAYLDSNSWTLLNTLYFVFDMGRFEAFKSSGYLRLIENQTLLKHLMTLYTITIPFQMQADHTVFDNRRQYFNEHLGPKANYVPGKREDDQIMVSKLIEDPWFRYMVMDYSGYLKERKTQKRRMAREMKKIAAEIARELEK